MTFNLKGLAVAAASAALSLAVQGQAQAETYMFDLTGTLNNDGVDPVSVSGELTIDLSESAYFSVPYDDSFSIQSANINVSGDGALTICPSCSYYSQYYIAGSPGSSFTLSDSIFGGNEVDIHLTPVFSNDRVIDIGSFASAELRDNGDFENLTGTFNAVPEPTAWALMLLGVGGLGAALRSRRKAAIVSA